MRESIAAACRKYTLASYPNIANAMGLRSHSSWHSAHLRFNERPAEERDKFMREIGDRLER
jgi:chromosomal replication initiation ATPase DnaA